MSTRGRSKRFAGRGPLWVKTGKPQTEQMLSALPRIATEERTFRIGSSVPKS